MESEVVPERGASDPRHRGAEPETLLYTRKIPPQTPLYSLTYRTLLRVIPKRMLHTTPKYHPRSVPPSLA